MPPFLVVVSGCFVVSECFNCATCNFFFFFFYHVLSSIKKLISPYYRDQILPKCTRLMLLLKIGNKFFLEKEIGNKLGLPDLSSKDFKFLVIVLRFVVS